MEGEQWVDVVWKEGSGWMWYGRRAVGGFSMEGGQWVDVAIETVIDQTNASTNHESFSSSCSSSVVSMLKLIINNLYHNTH